MVPNPGGVIQDVIVGVTNTAGANVIAIGEVLDAPWPSKDGSGEVAYPSGAILDAIEEISDQDGATPDGI